MLGESQKSSTKDALLDSAEELFILKGYSAVSTRELADSAQVNLGAIKYHFGSKAQLFVETVRRMMSQRQEKNRLLESDISDASREEASVDFCKFVQVLLHDMCIPDGPDVCRLMCREIHGVASADPELFEPLVASVTEEFIRPLDQHLCSLIKILIPKADDDEVQLTAQSVIGQCSFYSTHRPFTERLRSVSLDEPGRLDSIHQHICRLTLRALGCDEEAINRAIATVTENEEKQ